MDGTEIPKRLENQLLKLLKLSIICQTKKEKRENYIHTRVYREAEIRIMLTEGVKRLENLIIFYLILKEICIQHAFL